MEGSHCQAFNRCCRNAVSRYYGTGNELRRREGVYEVIELGGGVVLLAGLRLFAFLGAS